MNRIKNLALTLAALLTAGLALAPAEADAQVRRGQGTGMHSRQWVVRPLVVRTERESNEFRAWFERGESRRDTDLKRTVQRLDETLERLRRLASDDRPGIGRDELRDAVGYARTIDRRIYRRADHRVTIREWVDLRQTLNQLARLYDIRGV